MEERLHSMREWFAEKADSVHARMWLAILSFTESCVFIIPPDPLLAAMVFVHKERWLRYAALTAVTSVLGAVFGYVFGAVLYDVIGTKIVEIYHLQTYMDEATRLLHDGVFIFTLTAAFTPIPFKVAVLAAGFTKANFVAFLLAAIVGRGARYGCIALVSKVFGEHAEHFIKRFWSYTTVVGVGILAAYVFYYFLLQ